VKSSSQSAARPLLPTLVVLGLLLLSGAAIQSVRATLVDRFERIKQRSDTYALPAPEMTIVASLGYRSALADLLFAHTLVSYGLHFQEKRAFEYVGNYLDTIITLDPKFRAPYYIADTMLVLQPKQPPPENYSKAREILERGMRELPYDSRLWLQAGQFIAYMGPAAFQDPAVKREWKLAGGRRLARACELLSDDEIMPFQCISAAGVLSREGEVDAMVQFLERVITVSDNPEIQRLALAMLEKQGGQRQRLKIHRLFNQLWDKDLRFASKDTRLVLGPPFSPAACAGHSPLSAACATSWRAWAHFQQQSQ
jgi:hypothetical protein